MRALYLCLLLALASGAAAQPVSGRLDTEWGDGGIIRPHFTGYSAEVAIGDNGETGFVTDYRVQSDAVHVATPWASNPSGRRDLADGHVLRGDDTSFTFGGIATDGKLYYTFAVSDNYRRTEDRYHPLLLRFTRTGLDSTFGMDGRVRLLNHIGSTRQYKPVGRSTPGLVLLHRERVYALIISASGGPTRRCGVVVTDTEGEPIESVGARGVVYFEGPDGCSTTSFYARGDELIRIVDRVESGAVRSTVWTFDLDVNAVSEPAEIVVEHVNWTYWDGRIVPSKRGGYYGVGVLDARGTSRVALTRFTDAGIVDESYGQRGSEYFYVDGNALGASVGFTEDDDGRVALAYSFRAFSTGAEKSLWAAVRAPNGEYIWGPSYLFQEPDRGNEGSPIFAVHGMRFAVDGGVYIAGSHNIPIVSTHTRRFFLIKTIGDGRATSTAPEASGETLALSVAPNPSRGGATLRFETATPEAVSVQVVDRLGRVVLSLPERELAAGDHAIPLDLSRLGAGVYTAVVISGERRRTARLTVVR